jgi:hypothetical protein
LSNIYQSASRITGNPQIIKCKYGEALLFNGESDGIFLDGNPLSGLSQFTIEAIVRFDSKGRFEQRFLHIGEVSGTRVLLENRSFETDWYFDAFIKSSDQSKALIDSTMLHPLDKWYHVAYVVDKGYLKTYINGIKELEAQINIAPLQRGNTSIGVRQNEKSWFKGAIYKIRITPKAVIPDEFMQY